MPSHLARKPAEGYNIERADPERRGDFSAGCTAFGKITIKRGGVEQRFCNEQFVFVEIWSMKDQSSNGGSDGATPPHLEVAVQIYCQVAPLGGGGGVKLKYGKVNRAKRGDLRFKIT